MGIMQGAIDNWPEEEAFGLYCDLIEGDDPAPEDEIARQIAHMHSVFAKEDDASDLIRRFDCKLSQLRRGVTGESESLFGN